VGAGSSRTYIIGQMSQGHLHRIDLVTSLSSYAYSTFQQVRLFLDNLKLKELWKPRLHVALCMLSEAAAPG
jgi:hypothetical protein